MLTVTGGKMILLSTPMGRGGFFYDCFKDPKFKSFHIKTTDILDLETRTKQQKEFVREYIESAKRRLTKLAYTQEVLGEFIDELMQFFPDKLIKECMTAKRNNKRNGIYYLGVDVARLGEDESTFEILRKDDNNLIQMENIVTKHTLTTETTRRIIKLEEEWKFKKIYIDDGGVGAGVFDNLLREPTTKRKVIPINNASRSLDKEDKRRKKILKEDLYDNLLKLMEDKRIRLLTDEDIFFSLKSVQFEYTDEGRIKLFGKETHICEGLIRAAWGIKEKSLNIWIA